MPTDRYALCFDSETETLGEVALRLLRMGIDVLYAKTADEAFLLAGDAGERIQALLIPPSVDIGQLDRVLARLDETRAGKPASVVVIGERPDSAARAKLRAAGTDWAVWNPSEDSALRYAVNGAMTLPSEVFTRQETRVPTSLMSSFWIDETRHDAVVYTLSAKGAFLETPSPSPTETAMKVEIWLPATRIPTSARVIYVNDGADRRRASWPVGMGIVFDDLSEKHEARLRKYIGDLAESTSI